MKTSMIELYTLGFFYVLLEMLKWAMLDGSTQKLELMCELG